MIPTVDFCGVNITRLIIGANPFGGYSHQNPERDREMVAFHTLDAMMETWARAEAAGINTFITNNETPHVIAAARHYLGQGGRLQWICQTANHTGIGMREAVDEVAALGAKAIYFHGGLVDNLFAAGNAEELARWVGYARAHGVPVGVAGHSPATHDWVHSLDLVDFHVVCFFNCGSLHSGKGERFSLADPYEAVKCIQRLPRPCIGYKVLGAGRIDAAMGMEYAFENIKPGDVINVGMHRGDRDDMVEFNAGLAERILAG